MSERGAGKSIWTADFCRLFVAQFLVFFAHNMLLTTFPLWGRELGGSDRAVGLAISTIVAAMLATRPFAGMLLDRRNRKKILIAAQLGVTFAFLAYVPIRSIGPALIAVRLLHGFFWSFSATAVNTIVAGILPEQRIGEGMGIFTLSIGFAMAFAPAVGFFLISRCSFVALFVVCAAVILLAMAMVLRLPPSRPIARDHRSSTSFLLPAALPSSLLIFIVSIVSSAISSFLPLYMRQLDLPSAVSFFTISAVVLLIFRPIAGRFVDRDRATAVIVTGLLLFSAVCVIISRTPLPSYSLLGIPCWLILAAFFYGIAFGSLLGSLQATALMRTTPECYGTATATFFLGFDCGNGLGPVLFGSVCGILGYRATYAYFALPLLVAAFLPFFLYRPRSK